MLTMREKENLISKYHSLLWEVVYRFKKSYCSTWQMDDEDLFHEAVLAFLRHMEKQTGALDLSSRFPFQQITHALCQYTLVNQVVAVPNTRTSDYKQRIASMPKTVELPTATLFMSTIHTIEEITDKICFDEFVGSLHPVDQKIIGLKMNGMRNREVAKSLGLSDCAVSRHLSKMYQNYNAS